MTEFKQHQQVEELSARLSAWVPTFLIGAVFTAVLIASHSFGECRKAPTNAVHRSTVGSINVRGSQGCILMSDDRFNSSFTLRDVSPKTHTQRGTGECPACAGPACAGVVQL